MTCNIISTPKGGLANKLRNLVSCKILANQMGYDLLVNWQPDSITGCEFNDLFVYDNNLIKYNSEICYNTIEVITNGTYNNINDLKRYKNICISGYSRFGWDIDIDEWKLETFKQLQSLQLNPDVKYILSDLRMPNNSIGIHIRRGDINTLVDYTPIDKFTNIIEQNTDKTIYLSTDDINVENILTSKYSNLFTHKKNNYDNNGNTLRTNTSGIQDALIDMLMLSRTSQIYGSYYSSFSEYAANFGNIPLFIVK